ncbi:MAG: hypothetical protein IKS55_02270 [Oscillospiraceae bacterium]|nr:hypothetical protein [Oscillospiraceae bacterium]
MLILRLETLDRVCLGIDRNEHDYLKFNVTCDVLGLPYLPLYRLLRGRIEFPDGLQLGLGRPAYYEGLIAGMRMLNSYESISPQLVLDCFTEICTTARGEQYRVLKKGQTFYAAFRLEEEQLPDFCAALAGITTLGYTDDNISGRVSVTVLRNLPEKTAQALPMPELSPDRQYTRLIYQVQTISPLCVFSPFDTNSKCKNYLPGEVLLDFIRDHIGEYFEGEFESGDLRVSNAYPVAQDKRGIPAPAAMVLHKLDKSTLEYRLAPVPPGKEYEAISQMGGQFVARPKEKTVLRFEPEEVKIYPLILDSNLAGSGADRSALAEGQVLQGFINGSDRQIRALVSLFSQHPVFSLGSCSAEGYGEVLFRFLRLQEPVNLPRELANEFDVFCLAPVILYDDAGMARYDAESLKQAIEKQLGAEGRLEIIKSFMQSAVCCRLDRRLPQDTAQTMCVQMGSSLRLRTRDGKPVNIAVLYHGFIGDRRRKGYGEVMAYHAGDAYMRNCEEVETEAFRLSRPGSVREVQVAAQFIQDVLKTVLRMKVSLLAFSDRGDHPIDPEASMEVLKTMRDRYASSVSDEELLDMYREVAERDL